MFNFFRWWQFGQKRIVRRRRRQAPLGTLRAHFIERLEDRALLSTAAVDDGISLQTADKLENYDYPGEFAQRFDGVGPLGTKTFELIFATQTTAGTDASMVGRDVQDLSLPTTDGGSSGPFLRFKFETVFTTKIDWSGPGDEGPQESITFVYGKLGVKYSNDAYSSPYRVVMAFTNPDAEAAGPNSNPDNSTKVLTTAHLSHADSSPHVYGSDSIWIDLGFPVQPGPDGQSYKPLFAFSIVDLDSRINVNVHGNALTSGGDHGSDQGWGPWEVSLAVHTVDWIDEDTYGTNPFAVDPNNPHLEISSVSVWAGIVGPEELAIIVAAGPSGGPHVKLDDRVLSDVISFEVKGFNAYQGFAGGVFVAAGDVNNDVNDVIAIPNDGDDAPLQSGIIAFPGFAGGVQVAGGDVNGDGRDDVITATVFRRSDIGLDLAALDSLYAQEAESAASLLIPGSK